MAGSSPSDRVRSGDDINIRVDIQRGPSGCLLPTRLLGRLPPKSFRSPLFSHRVLPRLSFTQDGRHAPSRLSCGNGCSLARPLGILCQAHGVEKHQSSRRRRHCRHELAFERIGCTDAAAAGLTPRIVMAFQSLYDSHCLHACQAAQGSRAWLCWPSQGLRYSAIQSAQAFSRY